MGQNDSLQYCIMDPTGNITALVESRVAVARQPSAAAEIMKRHPEVEQVGFLQFADAGGDSVRAELRMAGGEFCGNAAMCAAALLLLRKRQESGSSRETVRLRISGAAQPVEVRLRQEADGSFRAAVRMPPALEVGEREFAFGTTRERLPLVRMQGISHVVIRPDSAFFSLQEDRSSAEKAVKEWCAVLEADGLGLMFLEEREPPFRLTPLVYVPGSGTVFWETSCASGSSAVGMYLSANSGGAVSLELLEPGGSLSVKSDPVSGETWLIGRTRLTAQMGRV